MGNIRVVVADDHDIVRTGIRKLLEDSPDIQVVGEAKNGKEALRLVQEREADLLVLDIQMPVVDGLEVARDLEEMNSPVRVLILSAHDDQQYVEEVLKNGAAGYLLKDDVPEQLVSAVHRAIRGEKGWVSDQVTASPGLLDESSQ